MKSWIRSSLARFQASSMDTQKVKREGWQYHDTLVVAPEESERLSSDERQFIEKIGTKLYGRRMIKGSA